MMFRLPDISDTQRTIAAKLSVDAIAFFVVFGILYLLSEFVLPGIFSSRLNFFLFFLVASMLILLAALPGRPDTGVGSEALVGRSGRIALAAIATVFVFWGEKRLPLPALFGSALVIFLVLLSFFADTFGIRKEISKNRN